MCCQLSFQMLLLWSPDADVYKYLKQLLHSCLKAWNKSPRVTVCWLHYKPMTGAEQLIEIKSAKSSLYVDCFQCCVGHTKEWFMTFLVNNTEHREYNKLKRNSILNHNRIIGKNNCISIISPICSPYQWLTSSSTVRFLKTPVNPFRTWGHTVYLHTRIVSNVNTWHH